MVRLLCEMSYLIVKYCCFHVFSFNQIWMVCRIGKASKMGTPEGTPQVYKIMWEHNALWHVNTSPSRSSARGGILIEKSKISSFALAFIRHLILPSILIWMKFCWCEWVSQLWQPSYNQYKMQNRKLWSQLMSDGTY